MSEKAKAASDWTKNKVWKYFGAMFMEKKDGENAVSLTRLLALICFGMLIWKWSGINGGVDELVKDALIAAEVDVPTALKVASEIPDTLLYTFWGLLGGKTLESITAIWKGKKAQ
jgi:hypothetical protein